MHITTVTTMNDKTGMESPPMVETIDIGKVEVMVDSSVIKKVGRIVTDHTEEALSVIRAWMSEKA